MTLKNWHAHVEMFIYQSRAKTKLLLKLELIHTIQLKEKPADMCETVYVLVGVPASPVFWCSHPYLCRDQKNIKI